MEDGTRVLRFLVIMALLVSGIFILPTDDVEAVTSSPIDISLVQSKVKANVGPGDDRNVTINGSVILRMSPVNDMGFRVFLHPDAGDWPIFGIRDLDLEVSERQHEFHFTVEVPQGTLASETRSFSVHATCFGFHSDESPMEYQSSPATSIIFIQSYYCIDFDESRQDMVLVEPGETVCIPVMIRNRGNSREPARIWFDDDTDLEGSGWSLDLEEDVVMMGPSEFKVLMLNVSVPWKEREGDHTLSLYTAPANVANADQTFACHRLRVHVDGSSRKLIMISAASLVLLLELIVIISVLLWYHLKDNGIGSERKSIRASF